MGIFEFLTGSSKKEEIDQVLQRGAVIIDVRTQGEFMQGHPTGARNIPLNTLEGQLNKIKNMKKPVVVCCASGARSGVAKNILRKNGIESYNAGSWYNLD